MQESLLNLLAQLGLVRVDPATGRPIIMMPSGGVPAAAPTALARRRRPDCRSRSAIRPVDARPDGPRPAGGESKSKLWIPGME